MVRTDSFSSVPPHIQPPMAQVPSAMRELTRLVSLMLMYSSMLSSLLFIWRPLCLLAKPLGIGVRAVEIVIRFVQFKLPSFRSLCGFRKNRCNLGRVEWLKTTGCLQSLLKNGQRIATGDDHTGGKIHGVVKAFHRGSCFALENEMVAHGLHAEYPDVVFEQDGKHLLFEAFEVRVHYVERHLNGVKREAALCSGGQHFQMNIRTLMSCEADKADFAPFLSLQDGFHCPAFRKNAVRIGVANYFVKLEEIDPVSLQTAQGINDLACSRGFRAPVDLGHEKSFLAIAVAQRLAHANFTFAAVVVPTVVEKVDAFIEARADNTDAFLGIRLLAKMIATQSDERNIFSGAAQRSIGNAVPGFRWRYLLISARQENGCCRKAKKFTPGYAGPCGVGGWRSRREIRTMYILLAILIVPVVHDLPSSPVGFVSLLLLPHRVHHPARPFRR